MAQPGHSSVSYKALNAGELSNKLDNRSDLEKYRFGCRTLENAPVVKTGGYSSRHGMRMIAPAKFDDKDARMIEFEFSITTTFAIEMGHEYMRFYTNSLPVELSSATGWLTATAYVVGDFRDEGGVIYYCIEDHISGTFATDLAANKWVAQTVYEIPTPYQEEDLFDIQFEGIRDIVYFTHPDHKQRKLIRLADDSWTFEQVSFGTDGVNQAFLDVNATDLTLAVAATTGLSKAVVASADLFDPDHVGSFFRIAHEQESSNTIVPLAFPLWVTATVYGPGDGVVDTGTSYRCLEDHTAGVFATDLAANKWTAVEELSDVIRVQGDWTLVTSGFWRADVLVQQSDDGLTDWKTISKHTRREDGNVNTSGTVAGDAFLRLKVENWSVNTTTSGIAANTAKEYARATLEIANTLLAGIVEITAVADEQNATCDILQDLVSTDATDLWQESAWSNFQGHPRAVCFHEERIYYAGTAKKPNRFWASATGLYEDYSTGTDADESFSKEFGGAGQSTIEWMASHTNILFGLNGAESIVTSGSDNLGLTGANAFTRKQTAEGSKHLRGIVVGDVVMFVNRDGKKLRELISEITQQGGVGYSSPDLTLLADHISGTVDGGITTLAYQQQPNPLVWGSTAEGTLIVNAYDRDQNVVGWCRCLTQGTVQSVAIVTGQFRDEVWLTTTRTIDGVEKRFVEQIEPDPWKDDNSATKGIENAFYVDCGITQNIGPTTTITAAHLPNTSVSVLVDGAPITDEDHIVILDSNGQYEMDEEGTVIQIGLGFEAVWSPMRTDAVPAGDATGQTKNISDLIVRVVDTVGLTYGDGDALSEHPFNVDDFRDTSDSPEATPPFTGDRELTWDGAWAFDIPIIIKQTQPLPMTVIGVTAKLVISND